MAGSLRQVARCLKYERIIVDQQDCELPWQMGSAARREYGSLGAAFRNGCVCGGEYSETVGGNTQRCGPRF